MVVLGGGLVSPGLPTAVAQERIFAAGNLLYELSSHGQSRAIVLSGGPTLPGSSATEADASLSFIRQVMSTDFNKHRFLIAGTSFNTHENAIRLWLIRKAIQRKTVTERKMASGFTNAI